MISHLAKDPDLDTLVREKQSLGRGTTMSKRRTFTPSFKAQVVLEVLTGAKGPAQACQEYGIKRWPTPCCRWWSGCWRRRRWG